MATGSSFGRVFRSLTPVVNASGAGDSRQTQDLPYCTFALPMHASFVAPASASHFSIATL